MTKDEFKTYWEKIPQANTSTVEINELHPAYLQDGRVMENLIEGLGKNGMANLAQTKKTGSGQNMLYFGAKTINNLPLLIEVAQPGESGERGVTVLFKVPVLPLRPLLTDAIQLILTHQ